MPATADLIRTPGNNRVPSSITRETHAIWLDPPAAKKNSSKPFWFNIFTPRPGYNPGTCNKCGSVGHHTFECRNFLSIHDLNKGKDAAADLESLIVSRPSIKIEEKSGSEEEDKGKERRRKRSRTADSASDDNEDDGSAKHRKGSQRRRRRESRRPKKRSGKMVKYNTWIA